VDQPDVHPVGHALGHHGRPRTSSPSVGQARRYDLQGCHATFHESEEIQAHLLDQDQAINTLLDKIANLEKALIKAKGA